MPNIPDTTKEEWRPVVGFEGKYSVSNMGRMMGHIYHPSLPPSRLLTPANDPKGYKKVCLHDGYGGRKMKFVHQLVLQAFCGCDPMRPDVNHIDHNPANNRLENLEWCTKTENMRHLWTHFPPKVRDMKGTNHPRCKLTDEDVRAIRYMKKQGVTDSEIATRYRLCHKKYVWWICSGHVWGHVK